MENNIFSLTACVITITHNFIISKDIKEKIYKNFILKMSYKCLLQFDEKHEDDLYLNEIKDKIFIIRFEYNSGSSPNYTGLFWTNNIKDIIQYDLGVPFERVVIICSQLEPDRVDFFIDTENVKKQINERDEFIELKRNEFIELKKNELIELNKKKKQSSTFKLKNIF